MDGRHAKRLLLALGITGILSVVAVIGYVLSGNTPRETSMLWPIPIGLFILAYIGVGFFGAFRSPYEKYDRSLEDDWDR